MAGSLWTRRHFLVSTALAGGAAASLCPRQVEAQTGSAGVSQAASPATGLVPVELSVNGRLYQLLVEPRVTLLDALREHIGLTGTKKGCDMGACGACTVISDGRRINACLTLAVREQGSDILTVEGLAREGRLHPVQQAFLDHDGYQCGYCTSGQIMSAVALLQEGRATSASMIREHMSGNLCRCGAYPNIVDAIRSIASNQTATGAGG